MTKLAVWALCLVSSIVPAAPAQSEKAETPPIIPNWAFGHWVWEDQKNTRAAIEFIVNGYLVHDIPVCAVIVDSPWSTSYNDFNWNTDQYPDPQDMIDDLHRKGIKVLVFYTGCINRTSRDAKFNRCESYDFVVRNNYAINNNKESRWWKGDGLHVDFTNTNARNWWHTQVDKIHTMGIDGAKVDFAHTFFGDTVTTSAGPMSNRAFGYQYFGNAFDYNTTKNKDFVVMTYGWSAKGLTGFPSKSHVNWTGDFAGDWGGIKEQLQTMYRSARDGFSGVACEIGGYWKMASTKEQFIRYAQLASMAPIMINGGSLGGARAPPAMESRRGDRRDLPPLCDSPW